MKHKRHLRKLENVILVILLAAFAFLLTFPYLWALSTSLKVPREILTVPPSLIPSTFTGEHYQRLVSDNILVYLSNSLFNAAFAVLFSLLSSYYFTIGLQTCLGLPVNARHIPTP